MNYSNSGIVKGTSGSGQLSLENYEAKEKAAENENCTNSIMPHYNECITPEEKFIHYSLDYNNKNAFGKAEAYEKGLGYTKSNCKSLIDQIHNAVSTGSSKPYQISESKYGMKYKFRILVAGPNGNQKNVIAVYQLDEGSSVPRMITNYLEGK